VYSAAPIPKTYVVKVRDGAADLAATARALATAHHGRLGEVWKSGLHGFSVAMAPDDAARLGAEPAVAYVEEDQRWRVATVQTGAPWGLDRIDQHFTPLDGSFTYDDTAGAGVNVYIVDSGIRTSKGDFGGRAVEGVNKVPDGKTGDCNGHGTSVAGVVGGALYGVAKKARLVSVRVFDCAGNATTTSIQAGIGWVIDDVKAHRTAATPWPAVLNLSATIACATGCDSQAIVDAEDAAIANGIPVVVAAGNENEDTVNNPFASPPDAIAVGATTRTDERWVQDDSHGSNYGPGVAIWAPGVAIPTDGIADDGNGVVPLVTGTSIAAAHVSGALALLLATPALARTKPRELRDLLQHNATHDVLLSGIGAGSRNLLLSTVQRFGGSSVALARQPDGRLELFGVANDGRLLHEPQQTAGGPFGNDWLQAVAKGWFAVAAETNVDGRLELAAATTTDSVFRRQQATRNANSWFNWRQLDGRLTSIAIAPNADGRLEMFGTNRQGQVFYRRQTAVNSTDWQPWKEFPLDKFAGFMNSVTAATDANGRIVVVGITDEGDVVVGGQTTANRDDTDLWLRFETTVTGVKMVEVAVARRADGRLDLVGVSGVSTWHTTQKQPGGIAWNLWSPITPGDAVVFGVHVAVEANLDGRLTTVVVDMNGIVWQATQEQVNATSYGPLTPIPPTTTKLRT
jgi:subtilisin family serine protease